MGSFNKLDTRIRYGVLSLALLFATLAPGLTTALVSAAQITERSIALSSSSKEAAGVTYQVGFTAAADAEAFVVEFCDNSPVIGLDCDAPEGFTAAAAASTTSGVTAVTGAVNRVTVTVPIDVSTEDEVSVELTGIRNPDAAGMLYARIVSYDSAANAATYTATNLGTGAVDQGSVAVSITDTVAVSGAVLEAMTFCVSLNEIEANCAGVVAPIVQLGETIGDSVALVSTEISEGSVYAQISTNAVNGAVVRLKSSATGCGGLLRAGAPAACDIEPALDEDITAGQAKFGVKAIAAADPAGDTSAGVLQAVLDSGYNDATFALNWVDTNATGVTSTYGDPFLDTDDGPANNKNVQLTFGASVSNSTPAGTYSADLSLIATGKF